MIPIRQTQFSAGADLTAIDTTVINPDQIIAIPTGFWLNSITQIPPPPDSSLRGYFIFARSSLALQGINLANGVGVVDMDYPGEIKVLLHNTTNTPFIVNKGQKIAQIVPMPVLPQFPASSNPRVGGFGSTGT